MRQVGCDLRLKGLLFGSWQSFRRSSDPEESEWYNPEIESQGHALNSQRPELRSHCQQGLERVLFSDKRVQPDFFSI